MSKQKLSASVDGELLKAAEAAVARGRSKSVSAWVNDALRLKLAQERRLENLAAFVDAYEADNGTITREEMNQAVQRARSRSVVIRSNPSKKLAVPRKLRASR